MQLNDNIVRLRKKQGLTQEQLAQLLHVTVGAVSKWENGNNRPDIEMLPQLADIFQVSIDALLGYEKCYRNLDNILSEMEALLEKEKYDTVVVQAEEILKRYPNDFRLNKMLADTYYSQCFSKYYMKNRRKIAKKSIFFYERCLELYDKKVTVHTTEEALHIQIATLYALDELGKYDEAIAILEKYNDSGRYNNLLANYLFLAGRRKEAKNIILHHCIAHQIFCFNDFSILASMFEKEGDYQAAIHFLEAEIRTFEVFLGDEGNYANRAYAGTAYTISKLYDKVGDAMRAEEWKNKAKCHARKYISNPSMKMASMKYCEEIEGRMIDSYGDILKLLASE